MFAYVDVFSLGLVQCQLQSCFGGNRMETRCQFGPIVLLLPDAVLRCDIQNGNPTNNLAGDLVLHHSPPKNSFSCMPPGLPSAKWR